MAVSFPMFFGRPNENAREFLDTLEMAHLISGRDSNEVKLRAFPLVLREEARAWYDTLAANVVEDWDTLICTFSVRFGRGDTPEGVWTLLLQHRQLDLQSYSQYESSFIELWGRWDRSLANAGAAPAFLKRDRFVAGLFTPLRLKVESKFPPTFEEAVRIAREKERKLSYHAFRAREEHEFVREEGMHEGKVAPT